jgi:hypothetical protein
MRRGMRPPFLLLHIPVFFSSFRPEAEARPRLPPRRGRLQLSLRL